MYLHTFYTQPSVTEYTLVAPDFKHNVNDVTQSIYMTHSLLHVYI